MTCLAYKIHARGYMQFGSESRSKSGEITKRIYLIPTARTGVFVFENHGTPSVVDRIQVHPETEYSTERILAFGTAAIKELFIKGEGGLIYPDTDLISLSTSIKGGGSTMHGIVVNQFIEMEPRIDEL